MTKLDVQVDGNVILLDSRRMQVGFKYRLGCKGQKYVAKKREDGVIELKVE